MSDIILHHYPQSPVSEKIRVVLGIKKLDWRSVEIPRLPPKPDLMPLTGGYRMTPVMQIGADIFCDSLCIARAIQERFPEPTLYPGGGDGMVWGVSRWTDGLFFQTALEVVFGAEHRNMPPEFIADRGQLYFGDDWNMETLQSDLANSIARLRTQFGWVEERLATAVAAMENVRLDLLRLRAGVGQPEDLTLAIEEARAVGEAVDAELAAQKEVEAFT